MEQLRILQNGNIAPCPWKEYCIANTSGCSGISYWCERFDNTSDAELEELKRRKAEYFRNKKNKYKYTKTCKDKEEAKKIIDDIGHRLVADWDFLPDGRVKLYLEPAWNTKYISDEWKSKGENDGTL